MATGDRLTAAISQVLTAEKVELVDCDFVGTGAGRVLRVSIDRPGGVDIQLITDMSHEISRMLDEKDLVPGDKYSLEVSSPGLERPLRTPEHFKRFVGTKVKIKTVPGTEGDRRVSGTITAATDQDVTVELNEADSTGASERTLPYVTIERAQTVFEWGPSPKPGAKKAVAKKTPSKPANPTKKVAS